MFALVKEVLRTPVLRSAPLDACKLSPRDFVLEVITLEPKITDYFKSREVAELSRQQLLDIVLADVVVLTTKQKQSLLKSIEVTFAIVFTDFERSQILQRRLSIQALLTYTRRATWRRNEIKHVS